MIWFILSLVAALLFGIWLGLPGRYDQSIDEVDERLGQEGTHGKAKRHFTILGFLQKKAERGSRRRRRGGRSPFKMD